MQEKLGFGVELDIQKDDLMCWKEPQHCRFDLLLMFNVYRYFYDSDVRRRIIQRCVTEWVKPGGWAVFLVSGTGFSMYRESMKRLVVNINLWRMNCFRFHYSLTCGKKNYPTLYMYLWNVKRYK